MPELGGGFCLCFSCCFHFVKWVGLKARAGGGGAISATVQAKHRPWIVRFAHYGCWVCFRKPLCNRECCVHSVGFCQTDKMSSWCCQLNCWESKQSRDLWSHWTVGREGCSGENTGVVEHQCGFLEEKGWRFSMNSKLWLSCKKWWIREDKKLNNWGYYCYNKSINYEPPWFMLSLTRLLFLQLVINTNVILISSLTVSL